MANDEEIKMEFSNRSSFWPLSFGLTIIIGLWLDQALEMGQQFVNIFVIGLFVTSLCFFDSRTRILFCLCFLLALAGEIFLCQFAGLYTYREENLPLFVPPGHVLLYAIGLWLVPRAPKSLWLYTLVAFVPYGLLVWLADIDQFSVVLFALFLLFLLLRPMRNLFSVMFLLALAMEVYGTWMGNWVWEPHVFLGGWNMTQANPPFASGVLYCGLDFLTQRLTALGLDRRSVQRGRAQCK